MNPNPSIPGVACALALLLLSPLMPEALADQPLVVERGPNHSVVQLVKPIVDAEGQPSLATNSWTRMEDGLNYWDPDAEQWLESDEVIVLAKVGAVATRGQHRVVFSPNANDPNGALDFEINHQLRLRASPLALQYFDPVSGAA